ncbi:MAG: hypothetical protein HC893_01365 [Chloroflexaceae bacterium]|nr:hypothetical protein [Chloroflexaceae bacterium]NJL32736.1 hypothetical protein [Chloroflexaceae bacterium]NJO06926.1 hypothetical protein [Chloroflexaceae bacterium]
MKKINITSDMLYLAAFASIFASISMWFLRRGDNDGNAERFGIFVGLWPPTFAILARALEEKEREFKVQM